MLEYNAVIQRLREYIKKTRGLGKSLADKLGKSDAWVSNLINQKRGLYLKDFLEICRILNVDPEFFLSSEEPGKERVHFDSEYFQKVIQEGFEKLIENKVQEEFKQYGFKKQEEEKNEK